MISENKRIIKNTSLLYLRTIIVMFISLYTSRVILRVLGVEDFGIYSVVGSLVTMFSLMSNSMITASQRFISFDLGRNNLNDLKKTVSGCITIHILLGLIIVIIAELVGVWFLNNKMNIEPDRIIAANWVFQCSLLIFFFNIINIPYNAIIISHEKMNAFAYLSVLEVCMNLLGVYMLKCIPYDKLIIYAILMLINSILLRLIYIVYCKTNFPEARQIKLKIDSKIFKQIFSFAGWNMFGSGTVVLRNQGIDILLNLFFGVIVNAAKGISSQVQHAFYSFVSSFQTAINPQITKNYATKNYQRVHFLIKQGSRFSFYLLILLSMPVLLETDIILDYWLGKVPDYSVIFIRLILISLLIETLSRFMIVAVQATGKIKKYQIVVGGTKLLALPLTYLFLKLGCNPTIGIVINMIIEIVCLFLRLYFVKKMLNFDVKDFLNDVVIKSVFVLSISLVLPFMMKQYLPELNVFLHLSIVTVSCFISCCLCIYYYGLSKNEKTLIIEYTTKFINNITIRKKDE